MRLVLSLLTALTLSSIAISQDASLGDVARATRAQQVKSPHAAKVFSNEDRGPQEIKDGEDPLEVYKRAGFALLHDASHRCLDESSGNSGPGWKKSYTFEEDFDRSMNLWIGKQDSLPYRIEMHTETRSDGTAPSVWQEAVSCTYGIAVEIAPAL
jgi:hypothetical protein